MSLLFWRKKQVDRGGFTEEFYENQLQEMAKTIIASPTKEQAEEIIKQFKVSHLGEWIENDDRRNYLPDGHYQLRPFNLDDIGKYFVGTVDNGAYVRREIQMASFSPQYGWLPCSQKYRTPLDILSYRGKVSELIKKVIP